MITGKGSEYMGEMVRGFVHRPGVHCLSSSLRDVFEFHGYKFSEETVFGLDRSLGFAYWPMKKAVPPIFIGGRGSKGIEDVCRILKIQWKRKTTTSTKKAWQTVKDQIDNNIPVMLQVDMFYLDYFRGKTSHFGGHMIVLAGYDEQRGEAYVTDVQNKKIEAKRRKDGLFATSLNSLAEARSSTFKPFPPRNAWFIFVFPRESVPLEKAVKTAIKNTAESFLNPPIKNLGVKGIRRFAKQVVKWPDTIRGTVYDPIQFKTQIPMLKLNLFLAYAFIEEAGSGGGLFRRIYSRFLREASHILHAKTLEKASNLMIKSADIWTEIANILLT
ncbi:MAG: BtrH N-terminal domain-containing protein, partial [Candidatus Korarchaeota archaeon]|nr:BtrH N-terminal domain-containing protein [Candidatus Korarchaeota archaeon]